MAWWNALIAPVSKVFEKALDVVDELVEDKDLANQIKAKLQTRMLELAHTELITVIENQAKIIMAEAQGGWLQRNWRPFLMIICIIIIGNNYILFPYLSAFTDKVHILELPKGLWALLNLGVGGYIGARTVEKIKGVTSNVLPFK